MTVRDTLGFILMVLATTLGSACSAKSEQAAKPHQKSKYSLAIEGYNYTNHYIDSYSVNGTGGGNIYVSSPTSGGGGSVCCASYYPKIKNQTVHVKWQSGGCKYVGGKDSDGTLYWYTHPYFKEAEAVVIDISREEPQNMEVHIYPDDKVEAYVTSELSRPRMKLDENREIRRNFPRCLNDKEPK